mmetsp:Transcript_32974/g.77727  ORF Transcript_32974/g.77727 Transcript_32974/m.77727 type:complete len:224 (-) Transcript_32974:146-817(-)
MEEVSPYTVLAGFIMLSHICSLCCMCVAPSPAGFSTGMGLSIFAGEALLYLCLVSSASSLHTKLLLLGVALSGLWLVVRTLFESVNRDDREVEKDTSGPRNQWLFFMAWSFCSWSASGYLVSSFLSSARQGMEASPLASMGLHLLWLSLVAQIGLGSRRSTNPRTLNLLLWLQHIGVMLGGVSVYFGPLDWLLALMPLVVGYLLDPALASLSSDLFHPKRLLG